MQAPESGSAGWNGSSVECGATATAAVDGSRATCRGRAHVIDALTSAVLTLRMFVEQSVAGVWAHLSLTALDQAAPAA